MDFSNAISSRYLLEKAEKGRVMVRLGMIGDRGGLGEVSPVCRRSPRSGLWHEGVGRVWRGDRRKGRGRKWIKRRNLTFKLFSDYEGSKEV